MSRDAADLDRELRIESQFCLDNGFTLVDAGDGTAVLTCDVLDRHTNRHGNAHGGLIAALLDTAMGVATRASGAFDNLGTASLTINYLRPARGHITAHARVRRSGRTLAFCEAEVLDAEGRLLATASAVFAVASRDASNARSTPPPT
ncbi:Acyl-coenzyme A thioesterase PaaI [Pandoraea aquatica]|uniref:Acyl-coenzyme A thioesterase PaaI n=1 Tax=Pandoraea aquatica TaxID=2508290 RepID=A0A5E4UBZ0_9BURK|nr:PaaI family thioesterase [Pandoraea aquatica]VVD97577.1 Acyl-coenzyme A thioesterase PaaI [Pandoraea aquatica]